MMLAEWIKSLDKKPGERTDEDLEIIYKKLKTFKLFRRVHPSVIQQLCFVAVIEHIEKGVVLYKQGDEALNWYSLIYGSLDVQITHTGKRKDIVNVCTLGSGTAFGECVINDGFHSVSLLSNEPCTLLRVPKAAFQDIWRKSSHYMEDIIAPHFSINDVDKNNTRSNDDSKLTDPNDKNENLNSANVARSGQNETNAIKEATEDNSKEIQLSENVIKLMHAGWIIRLMINHTASHLIRDRKHPSTSEVLDKCFIGSELTDWIINVTTSSSRIKVRSRKQAESIYQVLYENKVILSVDPTDEVNSFMDRYAFYRFCFDDLTDEKSQALVNLFQLNVSIDDNRIADYLYENLTFLLQLAPEAILRQILRKTPETRTEDDIDIVYEEIMNIKAFSHLSNTVKKELSAVIAFESYEKKSITLFKQGDRGTCWYIILKGSVNVVIASKGIVCTLHEGDDFGKLALVNEAPRAATIITNEDECQFLRVDKVHFDRILKDNEASIVRLKECGKEVLILQKMSVKASKNENQSYNFKYTVMAGTPDKVIDYLLETRMNNNNFEEQLNKENLFEDFLLTFPIFITWKHMTNSLLRHYKIDEQNFRQMENYSVENKKRVARFIQLWFKISGDAFLNCKVIGAFLDELIDLMEKDDLKHNNFKAELKSLKSIKETKEIYNMNLELRGTVIYNADISSYIRRMSTINENLIKSPETDKIFKLSAIKEFDEIICRLYCADHTYTTLKTTMDTKAEIIRNQAAEKLNLDNGIDYSLVELKSDNERYIFNETELNIATNLSLNGRIFISHKDHLDALTTLQEQEGPSVGSIYKLENYSSQEIAYFLTNNTWKLYNNIHPYEFIYLVFGRHNFNDITANLDFSRHNFSELQYWAITEVLLEKSLSRRVQILKKLIKIAGYCKEYKNLNTFFAIILGLSNVAVSRLTQTWEKLHSKVKRIFTQYESLIDSSRNYRRYRLFLSKYNPPFIPFIPLLIKDMTIVHEGNKTFVDQGLVNFEKMHLLAQTLRMIQDCKSGLFQINPPANSNIKKLNHPNVLEEYFEQIKVIDNQKRLMQLSYCLEHRKL